MVRPFLQNLVANRAYMGVHNMSQETTRAMYLNGYNEQLDYFVEREEIKCFPAPGLLHCANVISTLKSLYQKYELTREEEKATHSQKRTNYNAADRSDSTDPAVILRDRFAYSESEREEIRGAWKKATADKGDSLKSRAYGFMNKSLQSNGYVSVYNKFNDNNLPTARCYSS